MSFKEIVKKVIWLNRNSRDIKIFIQVEIDRKINNETIGQTGECALSELYGINCNISKNRINPILKKRFIKKFQDMGIKSQLPANIVSHTGSKNNKEDFKLENNETLSLKTLKGKDVKICPQIIGQPTLKSWDKYHNTEFNGCLSKNKERFDIIKNNIKSILTDMVEHLFCCDNTIIVRNSLKNPEPVLYSKKDLYDKMNRFKNTEIDILYTRETYEEKKCNKSNKTKEFSTTVKFKLKNKIISVGEFQFHKASRQQIKFRFYYTFLQQSF
jgi:hypothetical protein